MVCQQNFSGGGGIFTECPLGVILQDSMAMRPHTVRGREGDVPLPTWSGVRKLHELNNLWSACGWRVQLGSPSDSGRRKIMRRLTLYVNLGGGGMEVESQCAPPSLCLYVDSSVIQQTLCMLFAYEVCIHYSVHLLCNLHISQIHLLLLHFKLFVPKHDHLGYK